MPARRVARTFGELFCRPDREEFIVLRELRAGKMKFHPEPNRVLRESTTKYE